MARCLPVLLVLAFGCAEAPREHELPSPPATPRPTDCRPVSGGDLGGVIAAAHEGERLCLEPGRWRGSVVIDKRLALWGPREAVIGATVPGSVVTIAAAGASLEGVTLDGTGGRFDKLDAAVHVVADDVRVAGIHVVHSVYGILVEKAKRAVITGNHVSGDAETLMGMRGDTIRLWETYQSQVTGNLVEDGRDMVVWYSSDNLIANNRVLRGRYGTHFMYSHGNKVRDNAYVDGVVGVFVMYSKRIELSGNLVLNASGGSGMGIGLKDSGDITVSGNALLRDTIGVYIDETPGGGSVESLRVAGNVLRQCTTAVHFHTTPQRTAFEDNDFSDNLRQVAADAGTRSDAARWRGNHWDDYAGYDLDDDGIGDLPHRAASTSEDLVAQHPQLAFLRGAPALTLVDVGARLLPLWQPRTLLVDEAPRMNAPPMPALKTIAHSNGGRAPEVQHAD